MANVWGDTSRPTGSTVTTDYGTFGSYEAEAYARYNGTGGSWQDGAGVYHNSEYEAREADRRAALNGGHYY